MNILKKLEDIFAPVEVSDEIDFNGLEEEDVVVAEERKVVGGTSVSAAAEPVQAPSRERTKLTLAASNKNRARDMKIKIYVPTHFDNVAEIADALKAGNSAVVNYERMDLVEQKRLCDFLNGVCYVSGGMVHRISNTMVIYVPNGVEINEVKAANAVL